MSQGYLRYPTIHHELIVFVAEDDLWLVTSSGGRAERLTAGVAEVKTPRFSPDGKQLAFVSQFEGPEEVCLFPQVGAEAQRLTFLSSTCAVVGWVPTGEALVFASNAGQFAFKAQALYALTHQGGLPKPLPYGLANAISYGPAGAVVIGRNIGEPAHWKRYRGGRVGQLWCDLHGDRQFQRLTQLAGNVACPCWIGERIYFLSDHEGCGNIYSCFPNGEDIQRHTDHHDFYARGLSSDGEQCVYHAGGDLYVFEPGANQTRRITVELPSNRPQRSRKFVAANTLLESYTLHPQGQAVALTARGKAFSLAHWDGPVLQYGQADGVRYRYLSWLNDGERLVAIHDRAGREEFVLLPPDTSHKEPHPFPALDLGRVLSLDVAPTKDTVALTNHRQELLIVDVETGAQRLLDRSPYAPIGEIAWSPDSQWLAYVFACSPQKRAIKLCNIDTGETFFATDPVLQDRAPAFDPGGKYLYFIGKRTFNPVCDNLQYLELSFPFGEKLYAITLQRDLLSPFLAEPSATKTREEEQEEKDQESGTEADGTHGVAKPVIIDLEGIDKRLVPFPLPEGRYKQVQGIKGKVLVLSLPLEPAFQEDAEEDGAGQTRLLRS